MLQSAQLKDVSVRYAREIVEVEDFLVKADCAVGTAESLGRIAARLPRDRAFHRDLTSHVWVLIEEGGGRISYSDLLGVIAIAAAGVHLAAAADEEDAHSLLRFLMEARRSLEAVPNARVEAPVGWIAEPDVESEIEAFEPEEVRGRRGIYWVVAVPCVLAVLAVGLWVKQRSDAGAGRVGPVTPAAVGSGANTSGVERGVSPTAAGSGATVVRPPSAKPARVLPFSSTARSSHKTSVAASSVPARAKDVSPQTTAVVPSRTVPAPTVGAVSSPAGSGKPLAPPVTTLPAPRSAGVANTATTRPTNAALAARLGVPTAPLSNAEQGGGGAARTSGAPILRRRPGSSTADSDDGELVAEVRPADVAAGRAIGGDATRGGEVRLTSLGVMAANIVYSPVPDYPAAASASHVQGEVKVSADVDRNGNVASARVISGPPLLRDAALDAVQRWRYRPYTSGGQPTPMTAVAVMDFRLP